MSNFTHDTQERSVVVNTDSFKLNSNLTIPTGAQRIVLSAHDSDNSQCKKPQSLTAS